jgi:Ca2+-binding RTX toxin-like protein
MLERLEPRTLLTCNPIYLTPVRRLEVRCDAQSDSIELTTNAQLQIRYNNQTIVGNPTVLNTDFILVDGGPGDEWIDLTDPRLGQRPIQTLVQGGPGNDFIFGTILPDFIQGGDGNDFIWGNAGNDTIQGNLNNDILLGDQGHDLLEGGFGDDIILGGNGNDLIYMTDQTRACNPFPTYEIGLGEGDIGESGNDTLYGDLCGLSNDYLDGGPGNDLIYGLGLNDSLLGGMGDDEVHGGDGTDYIFGDDYSNSPGGGNDRLYGEGGDDYLAGEYGDDSLDGGLGADYVDGGAGTDSARPDVNDFIINCELPW